MQKIPFQSFVDNINCRFLFEVLGILQQFKISDKFESLSLDLRLKGS